MGAVVGLPVGVRVGFCVGLPVGAALGFDEGLLVGARLGTPVVGLPVGVPVVGLPVGFGLGDNDGLLVTGERVGRVVAEAFVGLFVGTLVGFLLGKDVGSAVSDPLGHPPVTSYSAHWKILGTLCQSSDPFERHEDKEHVPLSLLDVLCQSNPRHC